MLILLVFCGHQNAVKKKRKTLFRVFSLFNMADRDSIAVNVKVCSDWPVLSRGFVSTIYLKKLKRYRGYWTFSLFFQFISFLCIVTTFRLIKHALKNHFQGQ